MSNRSFEMYEYRQVLVRMRQGDSDRQIAAARLVGRSKAAKPRGLAREHGWLEAEQPLPDDAALAEVLGQREASPGPSSQVEPHRERILAWKRAGITGTTIHQALVREHGFSGSYSPSVVFSKPTSQPRSRPPCAWTSPPVKPLKSTSAPVRGSSTPTPASCARPGSLS